MIIIFVFFVCTKCNFSPWKGCERFLNDRKLQRERPNRRITPYARRFEDERLKNCGSRCQRHTHWVDLEVSLMLRGNVRIEKGLHEFISHKSPKILVCGYTKTSLTG